MAMATPQVASESDQSNSRSNSSNSSGGTVELLDFPFTSDDVQEYMNDAAAQGDTVQVQYSEPGAMVVLSQHVLHRSGAQPRSVRKTLLYLVLDYCEPKDLHVFRQQDNDAYAYAY